MKKHLLLLSFLMPIFVAVAQKEYDKWYFGNQAGIDFSSGTAIAITNGVMNAVDNPATVSDSLGNLLFYCNGIQVWNRNHTIMPNGSGILGNTSGGHTATIIRQPGSSNLYYLFTLDAFGGSNGLRYNVIDMNLNGGLGDIVSGQKNILLIASASEQIVPVVHANGNDIWLVTHPWNSSSFNSYLVTCTGINITPVVSTVGDTRNGGSNNALGEMTVNAQNNRIATTSFGRGTMELFDFDNNSGTLSNALYFSGYNFPWGVEFSPSGNKLYLTGWTTQYVYQYDLTTYTDVAITASEINLGNVTGPGGGYYTAYMQIAPDNKIYIAVYQDTYLGVINYPDSTGTACNLVDNGFYLGGRTSSAGLPDKIVVTHNTPASLNILGNDTSYCGTFTQTLATGNPNTIWSTGISAAQITVTTPGTYTATISNGCSFAADTITISQTSLPFTLGNDTAFCPEQAILLDATTPNATYLWQDASANATLTVLVAGTYAVTVTAAGCTTSDTINIYSLSDPGLVTLPNDTGYCGSFAQTLFTGDVTTLWSTGTTAAQITVTAPGIYWEQNSNTCATYRDSIIITQIPAPVVNLGNDTALCTGHSLLLNAGNTGASYNWQNNSSASTYNVTGAGTYSVTVALGNCSTHDTIIVTGYSLSLTSSGTNAGCGLNNGTALVTATNGNSPYNYNWSNGLHNDTLSNLPLGTYSVTVIDNGGCSATASVFVDTSGTGAVQITADTQTPICATDSVHLCAPSGYQNYLWNTGQSTPCIYAHQAGNYYVTVSDNNNCTSSSNHLSVNMYPIPSVSISVNGNVLTAYNATSYQWFLNGAAIPDAVADTLLATTQGNYTLQITDSNGCTAVSNVIHITTGIIDISDGTEVNVFPNPNQTGTWNITGCEHWKEAELILYDVNGSVIFRSMIKSSTTTIETNAAHGIYLLKIVSGEKSYVKKLIRL